MVNTQGRFNKRTELKIPIISIRLFVVFASPPDNSLRAGGFSHTKIAPHPPGPGFPEQAPSLYTVTRCLSDIF